MMRNAVVMLWVYILKPLYWQIISNVTTNNRQKEVFAFSEHGYQCVVDSLDWKKMRAECF